MSWEGLHPHDGARKPLAEEQDLSIREATELWIETRDVVDPDDPLFRSVEALRGGSLPEMGGPVGGPIDGAVLENFRDRARTHELVESVRTDRTGRNAISEIGDHTKTVS